MPTYTYPEFWPRPLSHRPKSVQSRITDQQKQDLYERRITTRALAKALNVHEKYLGSLFYQKVPVYSKKPLIEIRKTFKLEMAKQVLEGKYSTQRAADIAFVSYNTMQRFIQRAKVRYPELVAPYAQLVIEQKRINIKKARDAQYASPPTQT